MKRYDKFLGDFVDLIAAKSVKGTPAPGAPFGLGVKQGFDTFCGIAERLGFTVKNYDGFMGEICVGQGEELGIIGHIDVVSAPMDGWNTDPFTLTKKDGVFYGRGVTDDKGPVLLCLYALKEILDGGKKLKRTVRFFIGLDEESGWGDVEHFKKVGAFPKEGFSPDGNFPVVYAEKGPNRLTFFLPYKGKFHGFCGGTVVNAVCDHASMTGEGDDALLKKYGLTQKNGVIESFGKAAHGSKPELGVNAIKPLLQYVSEMEGGVFDAAVKYLFDDALSISQIGNETGRATLSPDILRETDGGIELVCDFRVPAKMKLEDFLPLLKKTGLRFTATKGRDPLYVDKDGALVQGLLAAYNEVTGERAEPYSCSGATFASVFEQGVAFGPEFEGKDGAIHEPNEYMEEKDLLKMYDIYKAALEKLIVE